MDGRDPEHRQDESVERILAQAAGGDADAWRTLVKAYSIRVYALLVRQCGDGELAEEITQATFVKVVAQLDRFAGYREQGKFEPWLFRIAMNQLRDEMRRRKRQARSMDMSGGAGSGEDKNDGKASWDAMQGHVVDRAGTAAADPVEQVSQAEQLDLLRDAVRQLSESDQQIVYLRHTAGLSFPQIAETLGEPLGTVLARGHRALAKLRKLLAGQEDEP